MFSVALATVLFPSLSRLVARGDIPGLRGLLGTGTRQNLLLLVPAAAVTMALAAPITELIYQYGSFGAASTDEVSQALFWFSFSLPFAGVNLLFTRTFFSLQRPWIPTALAALTLIVNVGLALALYGPLGIAGPVIGTAAASGLMALAQAHRLRGLLGGRIEGRETAIATCKIVAASVVLGLVAYGVWALLDGALGDAGALTRLLAVGPAITAGVIAYWAGVTVLRVPEAKQIGDFVMARVRR
jgi:putative peptidoglycan lipid II flippase